MKHFYNKFLIGCVSGLLTLAGCTGNFEEWNTNQHEATDDMLSRDNLDTGSFFVQMQKNVFVLEQMNSDGTGIGGSVYQVMDNLAGASFAGYTGACNIWYGNSNYLTYNMEVEWRDAAFERAFVGIMSAWDKMKKKAEEQQQPQIAALATIVKVLAMSRTTDMYGPLPYTKFGNGEVYNPYDSQEVIYNSFFEELNEAIEALYDMYQKDSSVKVLEKYDFVYSGNVESWLRFANSLKLRLAMRIVYANEAKAKQMAEEAVAHPVGVMAKASDIAQLQHAADFVYRHPLYIISVGEFNDARMGATMDSYMNGYNDPRLGAYFQKNQSGEYTGIRTGISMNRETYATSGLFSDLAISGTDEIVWMNPSEMYFLRAEGAIRGWSMNGTTQELYQSGVRTSFEVAGVSGADSYLSDDTSVPADYSDPATPGNNISASSDITIKWDEEAGFEEKLERIITQKWLAIYPDGQEAWSEFRRTGYPKVFPVVINNSGGKVNTDRQVRRIPFPSTEYRDNNANVLQAITLLGGEDTGGTSLWWDKKNN